MEQEGPERLESKGFTANRYTDHIIAFFDSVVDINSNKLVLAAAVYIQNDTFNLDCQLYEKLADVVIFTLIDSLGYD